MSSEHNPNLWALLIGIDCYLPNLLPDGTYYRSLAGCVRDILRIEQFLRDELGLTDERLIRLTATRGALDNSSSRGPGEKPSLMADEKPTEAPEQWPTYANIVQAFHKLIESVPSGAQVYIHYSGHGGRVKTLPAHRARIPYKHLDEALVPTDLGNNEGQYLRDIELVLLLQKLVDKGSFVTLVLDSCHAGSATRRADGPGNKTLTADATVRGSGAIDTRPKPSLVASDDELISNWLRLSPPNARNFSTGSGWLPDPQDYVLLAACRAHEGANEYSFDGVNKQGALTYWLLDSFRKFGRGVSYHALHQYIAAKIKGQFKAQTAQLEGEGNRVAFGCEPIEVPFAFVVLDVDENGQVTLNAGRIHGLEAGDRFVLYSAEQLVFTPTDKPLAIAEIIKPGATSSRALLVGRSSDEPVEQGDRAVIIESSTDTSADALHLAKFRRARELENPDPLSPLLRKFSVELLEAEGTPTVTVGEWIFFRARNHYKEKDGPTLNVTVLNLRCDGSIRQIFPSRAGLFETLEPERELLLPLCAELPPEYAEGIDVIKFFVTTEPADLHFLELPPLDQPLERPGPLNTGQRASSGAPRGSSNKSEPRAFGVPISEDDDWTTRQFEIRVVRPSASSQPSNS